DHAGAAALPPLPSPWPTVGFHRANDVSWQTSFLLVPILNSDDWLFRNGLPSTIGLDIDRISTNRSSNPAFDVRWQLGLRVIGVGWNFIPIPVAMGPHAGIRWEHPVREGLSTYGWGDVGLLPNFGNGLPLGDLRAG